jgi:hypothetical protein
VTWARRKDGTHQAVIAAFRVFGWAVLDVSRAPLCVDLVVARHGRTLLVEVKSGTGKLTDAQRALFDNWPGETAVVRSIGDVADLSL